MGRPARAAWLTAACVASALGWCDGAAAATATVTHRVVHYSGVDDVRYAVVAYSGDPGEANRVTAIQSDVMRFVDTGATVRAGRGCEAVGEHELRCARGPRESFEPVIRAGDGDDEVRASGINFWELSGGPGDDVLGVIPDPSGLDGAARLEGDSGDDVLVGGDYIDYLHGGAGADTLRGGDEADNLIGDGGHGPWSPDTIDGGTGGDEVSYENRTRGVTVDLGRRRGGAPGEDDRLRSVEGVVGSRGSDRIFGTDRGDGLRADQENGTRRAHDLIVGRGGDDSLTGSPGADRLVGGPGADEIDGDSGDDELIGGPGRDELRGSVGANRYEGGTGDDGVELDLDEQPTRVSCGAGGGDDVYLPSPGHSIQRDCERVQLDELDLHTRLERSGASSLALSFVQLAGVSEYPSCAIAVKLSEPADAGPSRFLGRGEVQGYEGHTRRMKIALSRRGERLLLHGRTRVVPVQIRASGNHGCSFGSHRAFEPYEPEAGFTLLLRAPVRR